MNALPFRVGAMLVVVAVLSAPPVAANAPAGRYTYAASSLTVYDNQTKLTWQRAAPTTFFIWADAKSYCAGVGTSASLGGTGWRLPTKKEFLTLVDFSLASGTARIRRGRLSHGDNERRLDGDAGRRLFARDRLVCDPGIASPLDVANAATVRCVR